MSYGYTFEAQINQLKISEHFQNKLIYFRVYIWYLLSWLWPGVVLVLRVMSLLTPHDTAQPSQWSLGPWQWPTHSAPWEQFSSSLHPVATGAGAMRTQNSQWQRVITSTVGPDTGASAARDFYFRPSKKLSKKVCRKFQEAVIGPAAAGQQWPDARHWGLGSENIKYCNKVSPEFWEAVTRWCSCDQWEGFMTNNQVLPETRHPVPTRLRGRAVLKQLFCVDFSKEPVQHKRLNSNAKTRRGMGNHSFTFMFLWILFGCDWIEGERMRERAAVMWLGEASPE